jgi:uncharacterized oligopeptide transporter (OPT) family protein
MQDLKTGALLKASPRSQFYGQMIGSLASVFVSVGAYKLYTRIYEVGRDPLFHPEKLIILVDSGTRVPRTNRRDLVGHGIHTLEQILML